MALISASGASCFTCTSSTPRWNYDVFLSFRGEDTRKNFTDHLYAALQRTGIVTFRDDEELERGEVISEKLMKAIEESLFAIIILSQDYASSSWCLDELQKIVESRKDLGQTIFPVFYNVDPSDIRHQKGNIGRAFEKHEEKFTEKKVQRWKEALTDVANLAGWDARDKHEAGIIEDISAAVWTKLRDKLPSNFDYLVGIKSKADNLISILKIGLDDKCFIGIWGMGGIGKTTIARVVFDAIQSKFETSCFLANVREESECNGLVYLQKKLLSCLLLRDIEINDSYGGVKATRKFLCKKNVLIVLDDISHISQLENLAGNKEWFGDGSRIIVTTRDMHLLTSHGQFEKYQIEMLNENESLNLLCQKAFKKNYPEEGYLELSKKVVEYAGGLPLALQVLGSLLCKRSQSEWRDTLDKLKQSLCKDIFNILRISYDELEDEEYKTIFLDVACFFNWKEKCKVTKILKGCGLHSTIGINVLIEKSLLSLDPKGPRDGYLYMHDLLQEMGKNIVLEESPNDAGRRSRLWSQQQIDQVLTRNRGTEKIQGIVLELQQQYNTNWHPNCFSNMHNLKLLYLKDVSLSNSLNSLPSALKVLIWEPYPLEALPQNIDQLYELVELELRHSKIRHLWNGTPFLGNLKFINLSDSENLIETPDFSRVLNLEGLFLEYCTSLVKVHESLGQLKKLVKLNLRGCKNLVTLPRKLETNSLEELHLSGCSKLEKLPEFGENMNRLSIFDIWGSHNIREVPSSIIHVTNLKELSFRGCKGQAWNLRSFCVYFGLPIFHFKRTSNPVGLKLPDSFSGLSLLRELDLSRCNLCDGSIPNDLSGLSSLMILDLSFNNFASLPIGCISNLLNLEQFYLNGCARLQSMPHLPPNLLTLDASGCPSMQPLDVQHLFASHFSKRRSPLLHEAILLLISGDTVPITWFKEQECYVNPSGAIVSITIDIPYIHEESEWSGIAVCFMVKCRNPHRLNVDYSFYWSFKALEDKSFSKQERNFYSWNSYSKKPDLYIAFFPYNAQNCWQHLRGEHRQLQLEMKFQKWSDFDINDCGWRLICKKDFEVYSATTGIASSSLQIAELGKVVD